MTENDIQSGEVDRFIMDRIDGVPHLEALLFLWRDRPKPSPTESVAKHLYVESEVANGILLDLARKNLVELDTDSAYRYAGDAATDRLVHSLNEVYRTELIRVTRMIHSKPSLALREFARAFRLKKED